MAELLGAGGLGVVGAVEVAAAPAGTDAGAPGSCPPASAVSDHSPNSTTTTTARAAARRRQYTSSGYGPIGSNMRRTVTHSCQLTT